MAAISQDLLRTAAMDHHDLVAALCHDLKIAERIDRRLLPDVQRKVSPGIASITCVEMAMKLYGLIPKNLAKGWKCRIFSYFNQQTRKALDLRYRSTKGISGRDGLYGP